MVHTSSGIVFFICVTAFYATSQEDPCLEFKPGKYQKQLPEETEILDRKQKTEKDANKLQWSQIVNLRIQRQDISASANLQTAYLVNGDYRFSLLYRKQKENRQQEISIRDETRFIGKPDSVVIQDDRLIVKAKWTNGKQNKLKILASSEIETRKTAQFEVIKSKENQSRALQAAFLNPAVIYLVCGFELPILEKSHIELGLSGARIQFITREEMKNTLSSTIISKELREKGVLLDGGSAFSFQLNHVWAKKLSLNQKARFFIPFSAEKPQEFELDSKLSYAAGKMIETSWRCQWRYDSSRYPPVSWVNTMDIGFKFGNN